ncbi:MAG: hypothetical protein Pars2KO_00030 [Parasphingorhabdus sp.]
MGDGVMKSIKKVGLVAGFLLFSSSAIAQQTSGEIGYSKGALGYDALLAGHNDTALKQLEAAERVRKDDPARLINLGQAYVRAGRHGDAAQMFMAAMNSNRSFDLLLADGTVMNSRKAAELALNSLNNNLASR